MRKMYREYGKRKYAKYRSEGRCCTCGEPVSMRKDGKPYSRCDKCRTMYAEKERKRRSEK